MTPSGSAPGSHHGPKGFVTPGAPRLPQLRDILRWQLHRDKRKWPRWVETPSQSPFKPFSGSPNGGRATWINHSTFLLELGGLNILTDPIFSLCAGPAGRLGPRRVHAPGIPLEALPKIDAVLLSHDHYDHCDLPTLAWLAKRDQPAGLTLLGNGDLLRRAGFRNIREMDWWDRLTLPHDLTVTATPAQHWSKRVSSARCRRLWGGFRVQGPDVSVHFVGDTGYHTTLFRETRQRLGPVDLALIPIGAYEPRWFMRGQHVDPEEAVEIHIELEAKKSIAMHWGTFQLTDEGRMEPVEGLRKALATLGLAQDSFVALEPGGGLEF